MEEKKTMQQINVLFEPNEINEAEIERNIRQINPLTQIQQIDEWLHTAMSENTTKSRAAEYRKKAFLCIDSLLLKHDTVLIYINLLIQAGVYFQCASLCDDIGAASMADQRLARQMYSEAIQLAEKKEPSIALYAYLPTLHYMTTFRYKEDALSETVAGFQHRAFLLARLFPIFQPHQPNIDLRTDYEAYLSFTRHYLVNLIDRLNTLSQDDKVATLYIAYEGGLRGWYPKPGETERLREQLIDALLVQKGWDNNDITTQHYFAIYHD